MSIKRYVYIVILLVNLVLIFNLYGVIGWEDPVLVSFDKYINKYPDIFQDDNERTFITWTSYQNNIPFVYFTYKDSIWHKPELVTRFDMNKIIYPSITVKEGKINIIVNDNDNLLKLFYKDIDANEKFREITLVTNERLNILPHVYNVNNDIFLFFQSYRNEKEFNINYIKDIKIDRFPYKSETLITAGQDEYGSFFPVIRFYKNEAYVLWIDRRGEGNSRNDVVYLKYSSDNYQTWSDNIILSEKEKDAKFPDFIIYEDKLYLIYYVSEYENIKSSLVIKIYDLNDFNLLYSNKLELDFSDFYQLKLRHFQDKFYLFWYSYIKKEPQIFSIESEDFKLWSSPARITGAGNNKLACSVEKDKLALVYESGNRNKSLIYFQEKDVQCPPPVLFSTTHKTNIVSYKNSVIFKWKEPYDISGIKGYAYLLDQLPGTIPEIENLPANFNGKSFEDLQDGIYYFHLKAVDGADNFSTVVHYKFMINTGLLEPPVIYSATHKEYIPSKNASAEFNWIMNRDRIVKGYSYLLTQNEELVPDKKINTKKTNIRFENLKEGIWYFKIRACDPLNRWSDYSTFTITIEKIIIATQMPEESESRYSYIIKPGDVLSQVIMRILKIHKENEWREYEKSIGKFNYLQNLDFLKPGDVIMFPIIIASPSDSIETISKEVFGSENQTDKIVIIGDKNVLSAGDMVIIKDKYFLKTGKIPAGP